MHFLYEHPQTGAQIWQGGERDLPEAVERKIKAVSFAAHDWQPQNVGSGLVCYYAPFRDNSSPELAELVAMKASANNLARILLAHVNKGEHVLSCCRSGLNRSSLVSGFLLMSITSWSGEDVIEFIRSKRSPYALNNDLFCRILRGEA